MYNFYAKKRRIDWLHRQYCAKSTCSVKQFVDVVNEVYYRHSAHLYAFRKTTDIEQQYTKILNRLGLNGKKNMTIVDIGAGTGFEYKQFKANNIWFNEYLFIEPNVDMINEFKSTHGHELVKVDIRNCFFEDCLDDVENTARKVIVINSCFHHLIWVREFLDNIKQVMKSGDILMICHEPHNGYRRSVFLYFNYFVRVFTTTFLLRKFGLWNDDKGLKDSQRWNFINEELQDKGIVTDPLKPLMIRRIIDYGVNKTGDWRLLGIPPDYDEGFWVPEDIKTYMGSDFEDIYYSTYRHFGDPANNRLIELLNQIFCGFFRNYGSDFCLALRVR